MTRKKQPITIGSKYLRKNYNLNEKPFNQKLESIKIFDVPDVSTLEKELKKQRKDAEKEFRQSASANSMRFSQSREGVSSFARRNVPKKLNNELENKLQNKLRSIEDQARNLYKLKEISKAKNDPELSEMISESANSLRKQQADLVNLNKETYEKTKQTVFSRDEDLSRSGLGRVRTSRKSSDKYRRI